MTFKHVKFEDSPVMRSLERVAKEKDLVKLEPLTKTATQKKVNLTPTTNLLDNVIRLCTGLRERGFEKQANELEVHLVNYKKAQTLYETSKEKSEDLVDAAHPEGSHKLKDVDSDEAVFEDILDQMNKSLEVAEKNPTGKLSNAKAIEAAKKALRPLTRKGQVSAPQLGTRDLDGLYDQALDTLEKFRSVATTIAMKMGQDSDYNTKFLDSIKFDLDKHKVHQVENAYGNRPFSEVLLTTMDDMKNGLEPSYFNPLDWGGPSAWNNDRNQAWRDVQGYWDVLKKYADRFNSVVSKIEKIESGVASQEYKEKVESLDPEGIADGLIAKLNSLITTVNSDIEKIQQKNLPNGNALVAWLNDARDKFIMPVVKTLAGSDKGQQAVADATIKYNSFKSKVDAFEAKYMGSA